MLGRLIPWLSVRVQDFLTGSHGETSDTLRLRFRIPKGFRVNRGLESARLLGIYSTGRAEGNRQGRPDLMILVMRKVDFGESIDAMMKKQRSELAEGDRLRTCDRLMLGEAEVVAIDILRKGNKICDVSYVRIIGPFAWICGYRCLSNAAQKRALDSAARCIIQSLQTELLTDSTAQDAEGRIRVPSSGFSFALPVGWERQDVLTEVVAYAPGEGFRARLNFTGEDDPNPELDWESPDEPVRMLQAFYKYSFDNFAMGERETISVKGVDGYLAHWSGEARRPPARGGNVPVKGLLAVLPRGKRGADINFLARADGDFQRHLPAFMDALNNIQWL